MLVLLQLESCELVQLAAGHFWNSEATFIGWTFKWACCVRSGQNVYVAQCNEYNQTPFNLPTASLAQGHNFDREQLCLSMELQQNDSSPAAAIATETTIFNSRHSGLATNGASFNGCHWPACKQLAAARKSSHALPQNNWLISLGYSRRNRCLAKQSV